MIALESHFAFTIEASETYPIVLKPFYCGFTFIDNPGGDEAMS